MYAFVLIAHSWWRWAVLALGLALLASVARTWRSGSGWSPREERLSTVFLRALDFQVLLGLVMYLFLSPFPRAALGDPGGAIANPVVRFFSVEHVVGMLVAVVVAHLGIERSRTQEPGRRSRTVTITQLAWLLVTLASIPWPALEYGRPFFRM